MRVGGIRALIGVAACALALGAAAAFYGGAITRTGSERAVAAAAGSEPPAAPQDVAALGRVEPQSEIINLGAGNLGLAAQDRLAALLVKRGELVHKGQVLGYLASRAEQIAQRDVLRAQLAEAKRQLQTETALDLQRIADAEIHQKEVLEVTPAKIAAQQAEITSLETALADAEDVLNINKHLYPLGFASRRARDSQEAVVREGRAKLAAARAQLAQLERQFEADKLSAAGQVQLERANLARAQAGITVVSLEKQVALAEARVENLTLTAPIDGRILNILIRPGEEVGPGSILTMGDTAKMRVVAEVYETDISRVRLDQRATITSRALAQPLTGKVVRIGEMIFKNDVLNVDPAARADARIVQVWIELDDGRPVEGLTNLTVNVVIAGSASAAPGKAVARTVSR